MPDPTDERRSEDREGDEREDMEDDSGGQHVVTDRERLRAWAEENDVVPATDTNDEPALVRRDDLDERYVEMEWGPFHDRFDAMGLALAHGTGVGGDYRLADRDAILAGEGVDAGAGGDGDATLPGPVEEHVTGRTTGWDVELPDGETVGVVADVDEDARVLYVEEDPGLTDRLKATLGWADAEDGAALESEGIRELRPGTVVVEDSREV
jgi:hypothetical protein